MNINNPRLFKSINERELWIYLNAKHQIFWEKGLTYLDLQTNRPRPTLQSFNVRTIEEALRIARNQCEYDEAKGELRMTLAMLLILRIHELKNLSEK